jgi:hypothetical protein
MCGYIYHVRLGPSRPVTAKRQLRVLGRGGGHRAALQTPSIVLRSAVQCVRDGGHTAPGRSRWGGPPGLSRDTEVKLRCHPSQHPLPSLRVVPRGPFSSLPLRSIRRSALTYHPRPPFTLQCSSGLLSFPAAPTRLFLPFLLPSILYFHPIHRMLRVHACSG